MATIGTDEIMGMLGNATIGTPGIDYSQYSSESIDDLINDVSGGGVFQDILGGLGNIGSFLGNTGVQQALGTGAGALLAERSHALKDSLFTFCCGHLRLSKEVTSTA